jgi:two-component system chemotaxis response regulator CheB
MVGPDHIVSADGLAKLLVDLVRQPVSTDGDPDMAEVDPMEDLPTIMDADAEAQERGERRGAISVFTCPECGGALWQVNEKKLVRFRCHVGHAYLGEVLLDGQAANLEAALWTAVRIFKEKTVLARQVAGQQRRGGNAESAERFEEEARLSEHYSTLIQEYLLKGGKGSKKPSEGEKFGSDSPETGRPPSSTP